MTDELDPPATRFFAAMHRLLTWPKSAPRVTEQGLADELVAIARRSERRLLDDYDEVSWSQIEPGDVVYMGVELVVVEVVAGQGVYVRFADGSYTVQTDVERTAWRRPKSGAHHLDCQRCGVRFFCYCPNPSECWLCDRCVDNDRAEEEELRTRPEPEP